MFPAVAVRYCGWTNTRKFGILRSGTGPQASLERGRGKVTCGIPPELGAPAPVGGIAGTFFAAIAPVYVFAQPWNYFCRPIGSTCHASNLDFVVCKRFLLATPFDLGFGHRFGRNHCRLISFRRTKFRSATSIDRCGSHCCSPIGSRLLVEAAALSEFDLVTGGVSPREMLATTSEIRIPADPRYIIVAKRAAAAFGSVAGFDVEAIDDLTIAVAQACENALTTHRSSALEANGQIRLVFKLEPQRVEVQVRSLYNRSETPAGEELSTAARNAVAAGSDNRNNAVSSDDLALRLMGLFVDECGYRVDRRTGALRVRLTKYRAS